VKLFVFCNQGYLSIRQTQDAFFEGRHIGSSAKGGLSVPDVSRVAQAYGARTFAIDSHQDLARVIPEVLSSPGPAVCALRIPAASPVEPCVGFVRNTDGTMSPRPLEDMAPFLDREEFRAAMVVKPMS
jgi:acetolactate synthase-1/2/3 large subunit